MSKSKSKKSHKTGNVMWAKKILPKLNGKPMGTWEDVPAAFEQSLAKEGAKSIVAVGVKNTAPCHESHKPLELGGGIILGASCLKPRPGFDAYIGLDHNMHRTMYYPWEKKPKGAAVEVYFPITDMSVPKDLHTFNLMLGWIEGELKKGKKLHAGCIGGHGRTGLLLAALIQRVLGDKDSGHWLREHYCKSAIESSSQVEFLYKHYGISKVEVHKFKGGGYGYGGGYGVGLHTNYTGNSTTGKAGSRTIPPVKGHWNIWR